ncbi:hypothetical protein P872_12585 [Rhodonellum psychrophilum GCM71 = DSM 17998]|uniref:Uncharacterized protein n=1 Tax=Rhodonellum psychrophilum GCM71 = DSM 17998 TaxID=1123057 RepID=U5BSU9_9BACT|nr:hypothetical protein P872_12585 [Rhodonellum psychrophilum GCM71 = DSM 17998]
MFFLTLLTNQENKGEKMWGNGEVINTRIDNPAGSGLVNLLSKTAGNKRKKQGFYAKDALFRTV